MQDVYSRRFVEALFDEMAATYGVMNTLTSFGFCHVWRWQCLSRARLQRGWRVFDFMSGTGENWRGICRRLRGQGSIVAVDFSHEMNQRAEALREKLPLTVELSAVDIFATDFDDASADAIVCSYGLKTLPEQEQALLAQKIGRILRPGGSFSFVEVSEPIPEPLFGQRFLQLVALFAQF